MYKVGDYVDISKGPLIASTSQIGRFKVTGVFDITSPKGETLQRVQGVSIPKQLNLHYWTFDQLAQRASKLNDYDKIFFEKKPQNQNVRTEGTKKSVESTA